MMAIKKVTVFDHQQQIEKQFYAARDINIEQRGLEACRFQRGASGPL